MKIVGYRPNDSEGPLSLRQGILVDDVVIDLLMLWSHVGGSTWREVARSPSSEKIKSVVTLSQAAFPFTERSTQDVLDEVRARAKGDWFALNHGSLGPVVVHQADAVTLGVPQPMMTSLRDFYAFEQHVKTANENRGRAVPAEWYQFPVFYFSNAWAIYGPEDVVPYPSYSDALDYELEVACVIGREGRNIPAGEAEDYIFGYMIFNDWSARDVQRLEMKVGLGPAKGKDFASSFGPWLVTPAELADRHTRRPGVYDLSMAVRVNGEERGRGNWKDLHYSFGEMVARASQDVTLYPGEVIGSGTVGTGCLLETTKGQGPYLKPGDVVELEIERLGVLRNVVGEKS